MSRPTEMPAREVVTLNDSDVADWLDSHARGALFFWDESDAVSQRQRARVELVAAAADIAVGILDVRTDALVAQAVGVASVPALVVFQGGEVMERVMGAAPENILREALTAR